MISADHSGDDAVRLRSQTSDLWACSFDLMAEIAATEDAVAETMERLAVVADIRGRGSDADRHRRVAHEAQRHAARARDLAHRCGDDR